jgi:hypothetical protein
MDDRDLTDERYADTEIRDYVANLLKGLNAIGTFGFSQPYPYRWTTLREVFLDDAVQKVAGPFFYGIVDYLAQMRKLPEHVFASTAVSGLKNGLDLSQSVAIKNINFGIAASRNEEGREIIMDGAMSLAAYMESRTNTLFGQNFAAHVVRPLFDD